MRPTLMNRQKILQGVSRSFALSIRLLPGTLRTQIGLAYLLARLTDTVADTPGVAADRRLNLLDQLQQAIRHPAQASPLETALQDFAQHVHDPHEQALLLRGQACLQALQALTKDDQAVVREVLAAITEGQRWDLLTLERPGPGVQTRAEVDHYTWQVAGSVGEFWTRICALHLRDWHIHSTSDLMQWGAAYGKGLQRLNILRDAHRDLLAGRCYFPAEALAPLDMDAASVCAAVQAGHRAELQKLAPLLDEWHRLTESLLHDGLRYSLSLRGWRLRLASALPCLIGIRTLTRLRQAGPQALLGHVKVPRQDVRRLMGSLVLSGVSDAQLQRSWNEGLAATGPSPA